MRITNYENAPPGRKRLTSAVSLIRSRVDGGFWLGGPLAGDKCVTFLRARAGGDSSPVASNT